MSLATQISNLATRIATEVKLRGTPAGGAAGQVLSKASGTDHDTAWVDASTAGGGLPRGGVDGQLLGIVSSSPAWVDAPSGGSIPAYFGRGDAYDAAVLADSPLAYWPDATGLDATGNGRHMAVKNQPDYVSSPITGRMVLRFPGMSNSISASTCPYERLNFESWMNVSSMTIEAVIFYVKPQNGQDTAIMCRDSSSGRVFQLTISVTTGKVNAPYWTDGSGLTIPTSSVEVSVGPHHVAFTHDATTGATKIYLDGVVVAEEVKSGAMVTPTASAMTLGAGEGGVPAATTLYSPSNSPLEGLAFYGKALAPERIAAHAACVLG